MINSIVLVGRLTKNPILNHTPNGIAYTNFTLAVNRTYTNQQGDRETDFINIVAWRKTAENICRFLQKGSLTGVEGHVQSRTYDDNDGKRVFVTEVLANNVRFLESKKEDINQQSNQGQQQQRQKQYAGVDSGGNYKSSNGHSYERQQRPYENEGDDDLPF